MLMTRRTMMLGTASMLAAPAIGSPAPVIMNWDGAILYEPSEQLIAYVKGIQREYERTNLMVL